MTPPFLDEFPENPRAGDTVYLNNGGPGVNAWCYKYDGEDWRVDGIGGIACPYIPEIL